MAVKARVLCTSAQVKSAFENTKDKWDMHRGNTQSVSEVYAQSHEHARRAKKLARCATVLRFEETVKLDRTGAIKMSMSSVDYCKDRHCPACQWHKSRINTAKIFDRLPAVENEFPNLRWLFLTLTVKNPVMRDLRETISDMNKAWGRLVKVKRWPAVGWLRSVEVTLGKDGNPHPHFHVMLAVKPQYFKDSTYIKHDEWLAMWRNAMRDDSITQVDIRVVKSKADKKAGGGDLFAAVVETLKYSFKPSDVIDQPVFLFGLTEQLRGARFVATGGVLAGILAKDYEEPEESAAVAIAREGLIAANSDAWAITDEDLELCDAAPVQVPGVTLRWCTVERRYVDV